MVDTFRRELVREKLLAVADDIYDAHEEERERYERAISTLHDTVSALRGMLKEEKKRREELERETKELGRQLAEARSNSSSSSSSDRAVTMSSAVEIAALRFELFERISGSAMKKVEMKKENADPNSPVNDENNAGAKASAGEHLLGALAPYSPLSVFEAVAAGNVNTLRDCLRPASAAQHENGAGSKAFAQWCKDKYSSVTSSALCTAASTGAVDTAKALLESGASVAPCGATMGRTALHAAAEAGNWALLDLMLDHPGSEQFIDFPDSSLMKPTHPRKGDTPLHLAARGGHESCARALIRHGANTSAKNADGQTPANIAAASESRAVVEAITDPDVQFWGFSTRANRQYVAGDFSGAKACYLSAIKLSSENAGLASDANVATLHYNVARADAKLEEHCLAIEHCDAALNMRNGEYPNALAQRASSYMALYDYEHAVMDYAELMQGSDSSRISRNGYWERHLARAQQMAIKAKDHYYVLGVASDATDEEVKKCFRKQCLKWHPDKHRGSRDREFRAGIMFKAINEANSVLSDQHTRTMFDIERISKRMDDIVSESAVPTRPNGSNQRRNSTESKHEDEEKAGPAHYDADDGSDKYNRFFDKVRAASKRAAELRRQMWESERSKRRGSGSSFRGKEFWDGFRASAGAGAGAMEEDADDAFHSDASFSDGELRYGSADEEELRGSTPAWENH